MPLTMHPSIAVHPGDWVRTEIIDAHGVGIGEAAMLMRVSRQSLSTLLNGRSDLSSTMAIRLEKVFGVRADTLIRMQADWDIHQARTHQDEIEVERAYA
ncbi:HigA family addiction module antitoxin [Sphingomonas panni]|uniref:HigA family addiction module antitoxin n=1 Tax=Sphingomonas panni TaxID=237612 RepID=UPI001F5B0702|nr:HigA family addiction module antitoxin [Sphingomonas panni]